MISIDDCYKQKKIYTRNGTGRWKVAGYFGSPAVVMRDCFSGDEVVFGLQGLMADEFEEITGSSDDDHIEDILP